MAHQQQPIPLNTQFENYAKYTVKTKEVLDLKTDDSEKKKEGKAITLRQIDFWFDQAKLFDTRLTKTDTGLAYIEFKSGNISYPQFLTFLDNVAQSKEIDVEVMKNKLMMCGLPGVEPKKPKPEVDKKETKEAKD
ncbi:unnamed protein product [Phyllotreta striolata]|uniref:Uncharacterized protein n=1 Tax=Phyllotreta striolata TaxID=444603 RepID=A0A9N9TI46_PHYSR|nr:unnamed protein product [Phyllotreta striolata]